MIRLSLVLLTASMLLLFAACQTISKPADESDAPMANGPTLQHVISPRVPDQLIFAGEEVPLNNPHIRERLEQELIANMYFHTSTVTILKRDLRWRDLVQQELTESGVPADFFYLAMAESRLDNFARSPAGAVGMWQFMPTTAKEYKLEVSKHVDERRDPVIATQAAARYLNKAHEKFGNWTAVAASYNRGMSGLQRAMEAQQIESYYDLYLNAETYRYVFRVLAFKVILENPEAYGYHIGKSDKYKPWKFTEVQITKSIPDLAAYAKNKGITYDELRRMNPWLDSGSYELPVPSGKSYTLRLPA